MRATLLPLSSKTWQHPTTGLTVTIAPSTLDRWIKTARHARHDPVAALKTRVRTELGQQRVYSEPREMPSEVGGARASGVIAGFPRRWDSAYSVTSQ